jgi:hypothetical protein
VRSSVHGAGGESQPTTGAAVSGREALRVHSRAVPEDPWIREAVRLHRRYQIEIVEAYGLCPWADRATQDGRVREVVILQQDAGTLEPSLAAIDSWTLDPAVDVAFAIYPRLALGRQAFHDFAARVRDADTLRHELGSVPFVFAAFHPDADADTGDPERLIPFLRRTPDPTLQFLRAATLDGIRTGSAQGTQFLDIGSLEAVLAGTAQPPLRERIARANLATAERCGIGVLKRHLDDIRRDRDETYCALAARA